jgi:hypothetical protein
MKKLASFFLAFLGFIFLPASVSAHCPLCVGGAAVGLSVARFFGIDDSITGVWIAALLGAMALWVYTYLAKKSKFRFLKPLVYVVIFVLTIWSFYAFNQYSISSLKFYLINEHSGKILGLDKLIFGMVAGGVLFYLVDLADDLIIKRNGKVFFPYQRIIVSLGSMLILSLGLYFLINYFI